ncbi:MAG: hypothetical protein ACI4OP_07810 [Candidatus Coprovivens sp.]
MPNKRQRKKQAKKILKTGKAYNPRNTFRSTISIKSTLFDPNHPKNEKLIMLAESNLNRLSFVITKPGIVNLTNLTEDDVKYMAGNQFFNEVDELQQYFRFNRTYYRPEKHQKVENIIRTVMNNYYEGKGITTTRGLDKSMKRLIKKLNEIERKYGKGKANPFVIVYYEDLELR